VKEKIFIDSDVLLDIIFQREPWFKDSQKILSLVEKNVFIGYTSSLIIANCYYLVSSNINNPIAAKTISKLRSLLRVLPFTDKEIGESLDSDFRDFEDGVQYYIMSNNGLKTLITRNVSDYRKADITVFTPADFLNLQRIKKMIPERQDS